MKIVLASSNPGKLKEFQQLLSPTAFEVVAQSEFEIESVAETGLSFVENAILKARHACQFSNLPSIADDSGLVVDALRGAPGIYSARYSGVEGDDDANNVLLLRNLEGIAESERSGRFHCALAFMQHEHDPMPIVCQASWEGFILTSARGTNGFGYDPLFYVPERRCTSAELQPNVKNQLSHRAQAMHKLLAALREKYLLS